MTKLLIWQWCWRRGGVLAYEDFGPRFNYNFYFSPHSKISSSVVCDTNLGCRAFIFASLSFPFFLYSMLVSHITPSFPLLLLLIYYASCTKLWNGLSVYSFIWWSGPKKQFLNLRYEFMWTKLQHVNLQPTVKNRPQSSKTMNATKS